MIFDNGEFIGPDKGNYFERKKSYDESIRPFLVDLETLGVASRDAILSRLNKEIAETSVQESELANTAVRRLKGFLGPPEAGTNGTKGYLRYLDELIAEPSIWRK
jgi:hypothetical protein